MKTTFETIVKRIGPKLHGITHKLNGHFTFFDDDDLYQEALVRLWSECNLGTLDGKTDSYILQGCYFHLRNYIRTALDKAQMTSLNSLIDEEGAELEEIIPDERHTTVEHAEEAILTEALGKMALTDREKTVLERLVEGMTTREIGALLGVSHVMVVKIRKGIERKCAALRRIADHGYQA